LRLGTSIAIDWARPRQLRGVHVRVHERASDRYCAFVCHACCYEWVSMMTNSRLWHREFFAWLARFAPAAKKAARRPNA